MRGERRDGPGNGAGRRRNVVVFTGEVRDEKLLLESVDQFSRLRADGVCDEIVLSTWRGELDGRGDLARALDRHSVHVLELEPLADPGTGAIWSQMRSLEGALSCLGPEDHVLKTRPEVRLSSGLVTRVLSGETDLRLPDVPLLPGLFESRIWVPWYHTVVCFHMADECFYGRAADLAKLNNRLTLFDEYRQRRRFAHIRRFLPPFLEEFPLFKDYLAYYASTSPFDRERPSGVGSVTGLLDSVIHDKRPWGDGMSGSWLNSYSVMSAMAPLLLESPSFLRILAGYYSVLSWYFAFDADPTRHDIYFRQYWDRTWLPRHGTFVHNLFRENRAHVRDYDGRWLRWLREGEVGDSAAGQTVVDLMRQFARSPDLLRERVPPEAGMQDRRALDDLIRRYLWRNRAPISSFWLEMRAPSHVAWMRSHARSARRRAPPFVKTAARRVREGTARPR